MELKSDVFILTTGRELYPAGNLISVDVENGTIYGGHDDIIYMPHFSDKKSGCYTPEEDLTVQERIEIADYMISEWKKFKNKLELEKES